jgi:SAM-dependent methyltransferase
MYRAKDAVDFFDMVGQTQWHRDIQRTLIHWIGLRDTYDVLDVGCGAGHFLLLLAQRVRWVTGLDVSESMLKRAQLNAEDHQVDNASFVPGNVRQLPFGDERFDLVVCMHLLFMLANPEIAIREMLRVVKPDGEVILVNPSTSVNPWSVQTYCDVNRVYDFERDSLLSLATATARYGGVNESSLASLVKKLGGTVVESLHLLDGFVLVSRVTKNEFIDEIGESGTN